MEKERRGVVGWMVDNTVAANLLMAFLLVGGVLSLPRIRQEVFPEATLNFVSVSVPYPGATPQEVEEGIVLAVEEAIRGTEGVKELSSVSREGMATVMAELYQGTDLNRARSDIESAVNRITSFPEDAEEPVISTPSNRRQVLSLVFYGELDRKTLRRLALEARRQLLRDSRVAQVELAGLPDPEVSIEVDQATLREYGLTFDRLAAIVGRGSVELPAGSLETPSGDYLLRIKERRDERADFENLAVVARPDGSWVTLGEIASIVDGFEDTDQSALFNGQPAVQLKVYRTSERTPIETSQAALELMDTLRKEWPDTVKMDIWNDSSEIFADRIDLLVENGRLGAFLVLLILGLFLQPRLAFWVTIGLPVSFLGVFVFMPMLDVSINMLSLFAFILVLGIVVDDAIVVGEATFARQQEGLEPRQAALRGTREVMIPVVFAVVTTIVAFVPLLLVPGLTGKFFRVIPLIVIPILILSLVESLLILPAHLAHVKDEKGQGWLQALAKRQQAFSDWFESKVEAHYRPFIEWVLRWRYAAVAVSFAILILAVGYVAGGRIAFRFLPEIESDLITARIELPVGAPVQETERAAQLVTDAIRKLGDSEEEGGFVRGVFTEIGSGSSATSGPMGGQVEVGGNLAAVSVQLIPAGEREASAAEITRRWREEIGEIAGVDRLAFTYSAGPSAGSDLSFELAHENLEILEEAARSLGRRLAEFEGVSEVDNGFEQGKPQVELRLRPEARALGVTEIDLARQIRGAFFGVEAVRTQRGKDELRVYVRRPESEQRVLSDMYGLIVRTPGGGEIPIEEAARIQFSTSYTSVEREQGRRAVQVTGSIDRTVTSAGKVTQSVRREVLPELQERYSGLGFELSGEQQDRQEALGSLGNNMLLALLAMYSLMAVIFRSYAQPLLILLAIPFGFLGALAGHLLMGFDLSLVSMFGLVALAGVVVNDSLVLIATINEGKRARRDDGEGSNQENEYVIDGAIRRFRPVLLTSLTTFFGLAPMIFETSLQARFLIPMALSLGFGVLFVTVIALVIVPALYCILEDGRQRFAAQRPGAG
ncbi:efflux RND transporter permease subunit [Pelagicoccus sp. SDUM812003]|nr:efflux RND transporter permease subunit [Pelagicoccus sp. SDUM812003]